MKQLIIIGLLLCIWILPAKAQNNDSILIARQAKRITALEKKNKTLQNELCTITQKTTLLEMKITEMSEKIDLLSEAMSQNVGGLHEQMDAIDSRYESRIGQTESIVQSSENKRHMTILGGVVIAVAIILLLVAAYLILRRRIAKKDNDIEALHAQADEINSRMIEKMDKELLELEKISGGMSASTLAAMETEPDHGLVKALAYGITRIEVNLSSMDPEVRGYKQLKIALRKMKDNLQANGYELVEMLGTEYNEGMTLSNVTFKEDSSIAEGKQIITRIIQPQINYKGKAIQFADIEVSRN